MDQYSAFAAMMGPMAEKIYTGMMMRNTPAEGEDQTGFAQQMSGVDWGKYRELFKKRHEVIDAWTKEEPEITSFDGLKLRAVFYPNENGNKKVVIGFHGYMAESSSVVVGVGEFFRKEGFSMLFPDARAHGKSDGEYVGFGCLDRRDLAEWVKWAVSRCGEDAEIWLYGQSMGGATVLMASGLELPSQVKGIISDSGFSSPEKILTAVYQKTLSLPPQMFLKYIDELSRERGGYGLSDCDAAEEVKKAKLPILFMHGSKDPFVPVEMCDEIYNNCASPKHKVIFEGAAHIEACYESTERYEKEMKDFIAKYSE